jgi:hypothetical protein
MTDPSAPSSPAPLGLFARIIGVITSPKATFQNIVAAPRPAGVLFVVATVITIGSIAPQFTEKGRQAAVDMQVQTLERFGQTVTPEMREQIEAGSRSVPRKAFGIVMAFIMLPIIALFFAAVYWAVFNTVMGGTATYKQVLAIVTHAQVIGALGVIVGLPIVLMSGKVSAFGPFNLGALAPMLEPGSTLAIFLGSIGFFSLWSFIVSGIGLGVLYRRSGRNIAIALIIVYLLLMYGITSVFGSFMSGM